VPFILIATFTMLNLFVAIIVSAMQTYEQSDPKATVAVVEEARDHIEADLHAEVRALREEIAGLRQALRERS
jgi:voltage-gated sodium channel